MKLTFLAIILNLGIISNLANSTPYVGKWHNVSNSSCIKEVLFFLIIKSGSPIKPFHFNSDIRFPLLKAMIIALEGHFKLSA